MGGVKVILDPSTREAQLIEAKLADGFDLTNRAVIDVADDFSWTGKAVDWDTLEIVNDLAVLKVAASARVNASAEAVRAQFLTPGAGQAMTYVRKEAEARAWTDGADEAAFPFLAAEATACGMTVAALAAIVIAQADTWVRIGSAIEALRRAALVAIETAETLQEIEGAQAVDWSNLG
jgi:hypothetical protein